MAAKRTLAVECFPECTASSSGFYLGDDPFMHLLPLFLLQCFTIVSISFLVRLILKLLKQPRIVSEIMGAIIIGPWVLGRFQMFGTKLFPKHSVYTMKNIHMVGIGLFHYLNGVKQDSRVIKETGIREWAIALSSWLFTVVGINLAYFTLGAPAKDLLPSKAMITNLGMNLAMTGFPCVYPVIEELNLLNSELGRMALSVTLLMDFMGWTIFYGGNVYSQIKKKGVHNAVWFILSTIVYVTFIIYGIGRAMSWIVRRTPKGGVVNKAYVAPALLLVILVSLLGDIVGTGFSTGAIMTGLATPDGPPLGAKLVESVESLTNYLFLPFFFMSVGQLFDVATNISWKAWGVMQIIYASACIGKVVGTMLPCLYFKMPLRDSILLGLLMNFRGVVELSLYGHWYNQKLFSQPMLVSLIVSTMIVTGISTFVVWAWTDNSMVYMTYNRRTIEHAKTNIELKLLTCIHEQENVPSFINLLEATNATMQNPICVYVLQLVELVGRARPIFISHTSEEQPSDGTSNNPIINAFLDYEQHTDEKLSFQLFTVVSPYKTMHADICKLAFDNKVSLIILPFHKKQMIDGQMVMNPALRKINPNVLGKAPCSVGILVDRGNHTATTKRAMSDDFSYRIAIVFLGGADDRESLSYASRMATHRKVSVTALHFCATANDMEYVNSDKELDDKLVESFKFDNHGNANVVYRKEVVEEGAAMLNVLHSLDKDYDLIITGRHQYSPLLEGLSEWSENQELGVMGDFLASSDFLGGTVSVLVLQQQRNRRALVFKVPAKLK